MDLEALLAIIFGLGVIPVTAIVAYVIVQAMKLKAQSSNSLSPEELDQIKTLITQNTTLKKRVENLEAIVTDHDMLMLRENSNGAAPESEIQQFIDKELSL